MSFGSGLFGRARVVGELRARRARRCGGRHPVANSALFLSAAAFLWDGSVCFWLDQLRRSE